MRLIKWLDEHLEETLMIILLIIIACVTMIQVIVRNVPWLTSLTWTEEFCRFMWIWSVFIPSPIPFGWRICSASVFSSIFFPRP